MQTKQVRILVSIPFRAKILILGVQLLFLVSSHQNDQCKGTKDSVGLLLEQDQGSRNGDADGRLRRCQITSICRVQGKTIDNT
jgi:hypothetical protein